MSPGTDLSLDALHGVGTSMMTSTFKAEECNYFLSVRCTKYKYFTKNTKLATIKQTFSEKSTKRQKSLNQIFD